MSRTSSNGPFDIIYSGGESVGCSYSCAVTMLPTLEQQKRAEADRVYKCAYLFPKDLLLPLDNEGNPDKSFKNIAIANSVGGYPGKNPCKELCNSMHNRGSQNILTSF